MNQRLNVLNTIFAVIALLFIVQRTAPYINKRLLTNEEAGIEIQVLFVETTYIEL
jgi:hypothetical protein